MEEKDPDLQKGAEPRGAPTCGSGKRTIRPRVSQGARACGAPAERGVGRRGIAKPVICPGRGAREKRTKTDSGQNDRRLSGDAKTNKGEQTK